jgi:hypothetical protein
VRRCRLRRESSIAPPKPSNEVLAGSGTAMLNTSPAELQQKRTRSAENITC